MMDAAQVEELGDELFDALRKRHVVEPLTKRFADITVDDAYGVSKHMLARRLAAGEKLIGRKVGLTNKGVQKHFGIDEPDYGNLTDPMRFADGADVPVSELLIQPKIEGEIGFVLKRGLKGPGVTVAEVLEATDYVAACFEIVDSRISDWRIRIADTIADNGSSGLFVMSEERADPTAMDLSACEMSMTANDEIVSEGTGAAALGSPLTCVAWLANTLGAAGDALRPGDVILSGSLGPVIEAKPNTAMRVTISGVGTVSLRLV